MIPADQLMPGTKGYSVGLLESVSDNWSITHHAGQLVWKDVFVKDDSLKNMFRIGGAL